MTATNSLPFIIELTARQQSWTKVEFNFTAFSPGRMNTFSLLHIHVDIRQFCTSSDLHFALHFPPAMKLQLFAISYQKMDYFSKRGGHHP